MDPTSILLTLLNAVRMEIITIKIAILQITIIRTKATTIRATITPIHSPPVILTFMMMITMLNQ
jgi:hypothetical protein